MYVNTLTLLEHTSLNIICNLFYNVQMVKRCTNSVDIMYVEQTDV